jgi:hypothetical protein
MDHIFAFYFFVSNYVKSSENKTVSLQSTNFFIAWPLEKRKCTIRYRGKKKVQYPLEYLSRNFGPFLPNVNTIRLLKELQFFYFLWSRLHFFSPFMDCDA